MKEKMKEERGENENVQEMVCGSERTTSKTQNGGRDHSYSCVRCSPYVVHACFWRFDLENRSLYAGRPY